jgi:hypothetical protein
LPNPCHAVRRMRGVVQKPPGCLVSARRHRYTAWPHPRHAAWVRSWG